MYKTSKEENEILTRVGRGTPMGEFLRRYWWPIGISANRRMNVGFVSQRPRQARRHWRLLRAPPRQPLSWRYREGRRSVSLSRLALQHGRKAIAGSGRATGYSA